MKMKRGLILSLCAMALGAFAQVASAQTPVPGSAVNVSLNLRYTNPANPAAGGKFYVVAKSTNVGGFGGLAGLSINISNIDSASAVFGSAAENGYTLSTRTTLGDNLAPAGNSPYKLTSGGFVNLVYGQDPNIAVKANIAKGAGTDGNTAADPLRNTNWANATVVFSGTFGAARPVIGPGTDANVFSTATAIGQAAAITGVVRGDSERSLNLEGANKGLYAGDANRDGTVNAADLGLLLNNYDGSNKAWDQGNFNSTAGGANTLVNAADLGLLLNNYDKTGTPVSVAAVPEPGSIALAVIGLAVTVFGRRMRTEG
jgi:hypothetical protein